MVKGAWLGIAGDHPKNAWGTTTSYRYTGKVIVVELRVNFALIDLLLQRWLN